MSIRAQGPNMIEEIKGTGHERRSPAVLVVGYTIPPLQRILISEFILANIGRHLGEEIGSDFGIRIDNREGFRAVLGPME